MKSINRSAAVQFAMGAILLIAVLWFYFPILSKLIYALTTNDDYSYGLLLPFVSGYLIYLKWPEIYPRLGHPSWHGLIIIALGFGLYIFGELVAIFYLPMISFVVVLSGLTLLLGGWALVRTVSFPLFLLFLMIPMPSLVMKKLTLPLQLLSSSMATGFLQAVGIPAARHGNVIDLGVRQLQVVAACSGLRYILSLLALGLIYCYFYQRRFWKACILLLILIPSTIIANALRVAGMGVFPALQEGFLHSFSGWLIFILCFGLLALVNWGLNYLRPEPPASLPTKPPKAAPQLKVGQGKTSYTPFFLATLALVLLAGQMSLRLSHTPMVPLLQSLDNFPLKIGPWEGRRDYLDPSMAAAVGADSYLEATFVDPRQESISLWLAYFDKQEKQLDKRIHSPVLCLTGAGWTILESWTVTLPSGPVNYLLIQQGDRRQVVYYWYYQRGRWVASEYLRYFFMGFDGLFKRRNDGAIIRLITPAQPDAQSARQRLTTFTQLLVNILPQFIPN